MTFGFTLGIVLGVIGFGLTDWQFWLALVVVNLAHAGTSA